MYGCADESGNTESGEDVVRTLAAICAKIGTPKTIRVDNGSEFISRDLDLWAYRHGVMLDFSRPGKPTDNTSCMQNSFCCAVSGSTS